MRTQTEAAGDSGARDSARRARSAFWVPFVVTSLTLAIFLGAILMMANQVRNQLRAGVLREDGEVLAAALKTVEDGNSPASSVQEELSRVLQASDFRGEDVIGVRIFDADGKFVIGFTQDLAPQDLLLEEAAAIRRGEILGKFDPNSKATDEFLNDSVTSDKPILKSTIPIKDGAAQFVLNAERVQLKLAAVNRATARYALWMCIVGASVIGCALVWAFRRLNSTNALLAERTHNLLRANHELSLAAKTSAVGAVAAHLIHGLKNPLTGLQLLVSNQLDEPNGGGREWKIAAEAARRMQVMIADIVRIMQEDAGDLYEVSVPEMLDLLQTKVAAYAREKNVQLSAVAKFKGKLANREANLVILALTNLIQNAVQASEPGKRVMVSADLISGAICFDVADEAGGIPEDVRPYLFTPCQSTKPGGTGIGLAITKQMASHMGGKLEVVQTGPEGTIFRLSIPQELFGEENAAKGQLAESTA